MKELIDRLAQEFMDKDYAHAYMDSHQSTRLATQIKVLREQRGLTQKQLAELSKMKQERICALEDVDYDAWTITTLRKLARAFDTTLQVSFIPFSQGIQDITCFSRKYLQVESREKDLKHFAKFVISKPIEKIENKSTFEWQNHNEKSIISDFIDRSGICKTEAKSVAYKNDHEPVGNDNNYQDAA